MVTLVTLASMLAYVGLLALEPYLLHPIYQHAGFLLLMACMGGCVMYQVRRVRTLSDYLNSK